MFRIPSLHFLADFDIRACPEAGQVGGYLNGPVGGGEKVKGNGDTEDLRVNGDVKAVLEPGMDGRRFIVIVNGPLPSVGQNKAVRNFPIQNSRSTPLQAA
jgi:hypothetical protein